MNKPVSIERHQNPAFVLPAVGSRALSIQIILLVSAIVLLPVAAHLSGVSVRLLLPMHWPVLLIGLCYGWRSGAIAGLVAPGLSFLLSGMPFPVMIPAMTVELLTYGLLAGFIREQFGLNRFVSLLIAIIGGRLVFIATVLATGAAGGALLPYLQAAMIPGIAAALAQVLLLPLVASWWIEREEGHRNQ